MKKLLALAAMLTGVGSFLSGGACLLSHFGAGDLMDGDHLKECLALFAAGMAVFSPGLQAFKVGVFARADQPGDQAKATTVTVPTIPPAAAGLLIFFLLLAPQAHAWSRYDCASPQSWAIGNATTIGKIGLGLVTLGTMGTPTLVQLTTSNAGPLPTAQGWADVVNFIGVGVSWLHGYARAGVPQRELVQSLTHIFCFDPFT